MRHTRNIAVFIIFISSCTAYAQQGNKIIAGSKSLEGTVVAMDGTKYWSGFKIESDGKWYTFVTEYNAKQGTNPTIVGGKCCDIGTKVKVTYIGSPTQYLLNVTSIVVMPQIKVTPDKEPMSNTSVRQSGTTSTLQDGQTVLQANQLITFSLAPKQEKAFLLQMKKGDFADVQWLAQEGLDLSFQLYDSAKRDKEMLEDFYGGEESIWFVAPRDGDFLVVSKLGDQDQNISGAQRISIQYNNKFKLPVGTKQEDIRRINGYDLKILSTPGTEIAEKGGNIVLIEKNGALIKTLNVSGGSSKGFSFPYPEYLSKADRAGLRPAEIAKEERNISLIKNTVDKTGDGIPDVMIGYFSGGAHCCFATYFINLGETVETVESISTGDAGFGVIGKNPKGGLLYDTADYVYAYWLTSFATSPAAEVILEFKNGKLRPNFDLMKKPAPSLAVLKNKAEFYRQKLNLKPYSGDVDYDYEHDPFYEEVNYPNNADEKYKGVLYRNVVFWGPMLDLIYTGNEELAWQFLDLVWPAQKQGKALFIRDFKKQLLESQYWRMILEDRGITVSTAAKFPKVSLDTHNMLVGTWRDENSEITYRADGTKTTRFDSGVTASGTWAVNGDNLTYVFVEVNGKRLATPQNQRYQILEITKDRYVAKGSDGKIWNGVRVR